MIKQTDRNGFALAFAVAMWMVYFAIIAACMNSAKAHSWYENSCCSDRDCAPVDDGTVTETKDGVVVKGFGTLSETDLRLRWSQDDRDHICASTAPVKLICVYRKRKSM